MQTLLLNFIVGPSDQVQVLPALVRNGGGITVLPLCQKRPTRGEVIRAANEILGALQLAGASIANRGEFSAATYLTNRLQPSGRALGELLLDPWLVELMLEPRKVAQVTFWIDPVLNGVPFESIFLVTDFLGFLLPTGREVISKSRRPPLARDEHTQSPLSRAGCR